MPFVLSIAWRLLLAVALVVSPILGLASDGGCAHGQAIATEAAGDAHATDDAPVAVAAVAMPGCTHMADMAHAAPNGKHATPDGKLATPHGAPSHGGCTSSACCLGGAVGMLGVSLAMSAQPAREQLASPRESALPAPPHGSVLRPPIA
jgi:hypothetical protein